MGGMDSETESEHIANPIRVKVRIEGNVQGVGFRPHVYRLSQEYHLDGWIANQTGGVLLEWQGNRDAIQLALQELQKNPPVAAQIESLMVTIVLIQDDRGFEIRESLLGTAPEAVYILPDLAMCSDCAAELDNPSDRRYGHPFISCTNCGPRFSIIEANPYDRVRTSMGSYPMCARCMSEYNSPTDRRFHAQTVACPECGPAWSFCDNLGQAQEGEPLRLAVGELLRGAILAVKGLGGYHLSCDARNEQAVQCLRSRKGRSDKPLAVMVRSLEVLSEFAEYSTEEAALLCCAAAPIVLLKKKPDVSIAPGITSGNAEIGVMLPYTPIHHLLLKAIPVLVMTSGNYSEEPMAFEEGSAFEQLGGIADGFLVHDRRIHWRCDDSVARVWHGTPQLIRRSRGYAPSPFRLARGCSPILGMGGDMKNTICLAQRGHAYLSPYLGDLDGPDTRDAYEECIQRFTALLAIQPETLVHDLHPDYYSTIVAKRLGKPCWGIQHHHAHITACTAEYGIVEPVIGVALDGTGYGTDGEIWGGEILYVHGAECRRLGHLRYIPLPGGEVAVREGWRMAVSWLGELLGLQAPEWMVKQGWDDKAIELSQNLARGTGNSRKTSSMGRLFDAVAAILGVRRLNRFEGQAAIELQQISTYSALRYPFEIRMTNGCLEMDPLPMLEAILGDIDDLPIGDIAGAFHGTVAEAICTACGRASTITGTRTIALGGGVFQNTLLLDLVVQGLEADLLRVLVPRRIPIGDGGLSFGQVAAFTATQV